MRAEVVVVVDVVVAVVVVFIVEVVETFYVIFYCKVFSAKGIGASSIQISN